MAQSAATKAAAPKIASQKIDPNNVSLLTRSFIPPPCSLPFLLSVSLPFSLNKKV